MEDSLTTFTSCSLLSKSLLDHNQQLLLKEKKESVISDRSAAEPPVNDDANPS